MKPFSAVLSQRPGVSIKLLSDVGRRAFPLQSARNAGQQRVAGIHSHRTKAGTFLQIREGYSVSGRTPAVNKYKNKKKPVFFPLTTGWFLKQEIFKKLDHHDNQSKAQCHPELSLALVCSTPALTVSAGICVSLLRACVSVCVRLCVHVRLRSLTREDRACDRTETKAEITSKTQL